MLYELNPNWTSSDGKTHHNSLGFRGREVAPRKRPGCVRIVCMGESTTYCTGIADDRDTYPARLEAHLRALHPNRDIEVVNAGIGGFTSIENLLRFHFHVAPLTPDLVIYYYTHNDVRPRHLPSLSRDYREFSRSWFEPPRVGGLKGWLSRRRALWGNNIGGVVRRFAENAERQHRNNVAANPPYAFRANITALALMVRAAGARLLFVNPPYRNLRNFIAGESGNPAFRGVFEHRNVIEELGRTHGFPVYDLARDMPYPDDPDGFPNEHYRDPVHVNERGAELMGKLIAEAVESENLLAETPQQDLRCPP